MGEAELLTHLLIYLGSAVLIVPLAKRSGLGSVLGYLLAGLLIGPSGLGLIAGQEDVLHFAEFGVVILLFLIGLELAPKRLWDMRGLIFGLGLLQVALSTLVITGLVALGGSSWPVALIAALGLSLSSTAIALQILAERNQLATPGGKSAFATLLFQDLAVIPILALLPVFGDPATPDRFDWSGAGRALAIVGGIIIGGRWALVPLLRFVAATRLREIFTASALFIVIAIALLMHTAGMSMALGTFLGGVLLANSEYRHALETDLEPFKGLLLGLFFIAIGLSIDLDLIRAHWALLLLIVTGVVSAKAIVLWGLARWFGVPSSQRLFFAITLSQGGEFAFVLNSAARGEGLLPDDIAALLVAVIALSMMTTPLLLLAYDRWVAPRLSKVGAPPFETPEAQGHPVLIAGFGRFGQIVGRLLSAQRVGVTVLEHDPSQIETIRKFGHKVFYGDATRLDLLHSAGAAHAKLLIVAIDDVEQALRLIDGVQETFPHLGILCRARNVQHAFDLIDRGVTLFQRETFESALALGERALVELGYGPYAAHRAAQTFRTHDLKSLRRRYEARCDEAELISVVHEARQQLEQAMIDDAVAFQPESAREAWK